METIAFDLRQTQRTPLADSHIAAIRAAGVSKHYPAGAMVARQGERIDRFILVEVGQIEVVDVVSGARKVDATLGPGQYLGEIAFLAGGRWTLPMRAARDTEVVEVEREVMLGIMSRVPEMSDIIIGVFAARRRRQLDDRDGALRLIGEDQSLPIRRVAEFAERNRIPYRSLPLTGEESLATAQQCGIAAATPAVIFGEREVIADPTPAKVAKLLGLDITIDAEQDVDVLIVGGGPAGVAAAVYAGAEGLRAMVSEDLAIGGQAGTSSRIENYMGFPTGISGADLVWRGEVQAMKFGTRFAVPLRATSLERRDDGLFCVGFDSGQSVCARSVVVATGVEYRRLPLDRLEDFEGNGAYYAATEIEARYCRGTQAVVIGGGNSAGQAAMYLSRNADHVHVVVRSATLAASMSSYLLHRLEADPKITIHYSSEVEGLQGGDRLEGLDIVNRADGTRLPIESRALFIMVGAAPNTAWLGGMVKLDDKGFICTGTDCGLAHSPYETSCPGVFSVGDVRSGSVKRVASAVGEGSVVISHVYRYVRPSHE
ncbi:FAD-dependent oxidoreductase [Blastomonas aquatica]|uniref:Thioredoxin reductase n=1 Tax=Blastomonas aquatica TaxID=1510276 RepID=A0ABQ1J7X8_9SPHN|nr:cyclic nucleotide-binding domain-containing thioredoxin-disulfide reductase [Blastomonas aquatica]GGB60864.1 thioredoxin reductase [Blastomonas aquatica]